ncbi:Solute carrier family 23 member 2 [Armadillidium vulgare]|nr:Solute carrier family 23 member 2 [Armadillidium vulgare]
MINRLPIIQGGSHAFLGPIIAIISLMPCPSNKEMELMTEDQQEEIWQLRMRQVQGAISVGAILQILIGGSGIVGVLLKWITPLTIVPTVTLIGLSLLKITATKAASNWWISSLTVFLLMLFSQYLRKVPLPWFSCSRSGVTLSKVYIFQLFPVLLALVISWFVCFLLTIYDVLDKDNHARTDLRLSMISEASWFRVPYPEAPIPPNHAMNRGIFMEGVGTALAGLFGSGSGTTSFSQNVAAVGITKVGSRRVIQFAGAFMILCGLIGKIGALFINIPEPIIGGIFVVVFAMITSVGLSNLQFVDLNSSRNLFVLGVSIFIGLFVPEWISRPENKDVIQTTVPILDEVLSVLLRIPMFLGGVIGFILDNTIPQRENSLNDLQMEEKRTRF